MATSTVVITFDKLLKPGPVVLTNWPGHRTVGGSFDFFPTAPPVAAGCTVTYQHNGLPALPGPSFVSYNALPPDLIGLHGLPVAQFLQFPLQEV